ncbi:SipW-dependent-type signal peptide-containing protein [Eubacterium sp. 1001713B170207_170306_E7]|uniref:SipW-dependent-type signal peptide-containing protein n=1 Tax=Eubacterium sp. 1001713B170207_170306_E7 TaxID=2787097 RepID=UPI00189C2132|nr:SipW-dependent-type signal peptide-containing protein [Eubacterium sp. 1001713B170207_170306_E7]
MKAKNKIKMFAIIALVALVAVGSTLAYLSSVTDTRENKFTSSKDLKGEITETEWDKNHENGSWDDYTPGESTGKNPVISIDDNGVAGYIAMKVVCKDAANNEIAFKDFQEKYAHVSYKGTDGINAGDWEEDNLNPGFFFFKTTLASGDSTSPLFDKVTVETGIKTVYNTESVQENQTVKVYKINPDGSKGDLVSDVTTVGPYVEVSEDEVVYIFENGVETEATDNPTLPSFQIDVTGYAVQADDSTASIYKNELRKLAGLTN